MPEATSVAIWRETHRELAGLDATELLEDVLDVDGALLLGDVEDDQPALAQLI